MVIQVLVRLVLYLDQLVTRGGISSTECRVQVQGIDNSVSVTGSHRARRWAIYTSHEYMHGTFDDPVLVNTGAGPP